MYSYLHAIDNVTVERYGIPAVYYYAKWKNCTVMAITLCENSLSDRKVDFVDPLNALIVFEQFVSASVLLFLFKIILIEKFGIYAGAPSEIHTQPWNPP